MRIRFFIFAISMCPFYTLQVRGDPSSSVDEAVSCSTKAGKALVTETVKTVADTAKKTGPIQNYKQINETFKGLEMSVGQIQIRDSTGKAVRTMKDLEKIASIGPGGATKTLANVSVLKSDIKGFVTQMVEDFDEHKKAHFNWRTYVKLKNGDIVPLVDPTKPVASGRPPFVFGFATPKGTHAVARGCYIFPPGAGNACRTACRNSGEPLAPILVAEMLCAYFVDQDWNPQLNCPLFYALGTWGAYETLIEMVTSVTPFTSLTEMLNHLILAGSSLIKSAAFLGALEISIAAGLPLAMAALTADAANTIKEMQQKMASKYTKVIEIELSSNCAAIYIPQMALETALISYGLDTNPFQKRMFYYYTPDGRLVGVKEDN
jgi:hypothetical protein